MLALLKLAGRIFLIKKAFCSSPVLLHARAALGQINKFLLWSESVLGWDKTLLLVIVFICVNMNAYSFFSICSFKNRKKQGRERRICIFHLGAFEGLRSDHWEVMQWRHIPHRNCMSRKTLWGFWSTCRSGRLQCSCWNCRGCQRLPREMDVHGSPREGRGNIFTRGVIQSFSQQVGTWLDKALGRLF